MGRARLEVDTDTVRQSVHTLDARVADLSRAIQRIAQLDPPPLGTFPHGADALRWYDEVQAATLTRLDRLAVALRALRDGNRTIAERYDAVESATHHDVSRHAV